MKKSCLLLFVHILSLACLYGQDDRLIMISSSGSRIQQAQNRMINYRPVYQHKGSTLSADSGYIYQDTTARTFFEGFGRVIITQPNGTVVYADKIHYTEDTQVAILTNNVRMIDAQSVLTTNYLTYNMRSSVGTYTGGGRIVNVTDTITSQNAYYFDNTQDAYFRHNVVVRTPNTQIYTDTMRYNTASKMVYFYGPTNIKGEEGQNLYTESGDYNTVTENAKFGKNNLYTEGSRFLTGDSLYYDGESGNGRAVNNVLFIDTADVFFMSGGLGLYNKSDESITMTRNPLVITVTRDDQTPNDSLARDSLAMADSLDFGIDTTELESSTPQDSLLTDSLGNAPPTTDPTRVDSIYMTADTLFSQLILLKDYVPMVFNLDREGGEIDDGGEDFGEFEPEGMGDGFEEELTDGGLEGTIMPDSTAVPISDSTLTDTLSTSPIPLDISRDVVVDTVEVSQEELAATKENIVAEALSQRAQTVPLTAGREILERNLTADSILRARAPIPRGTEVDSLMEEAVAAVMRGSVDSLITDSAEVDSTAMTRIIKAYRNVRLFKSDLQAVADSAYYGYPDSMMRFFGHPMVWAQGSQMSSDTMYMQIINEKLDNLLLFGNAFMVNTEHDSTKFNQIKGRKITGFFTNNELERLFVDGNAESIYYTMDDENIRYQDMYHSRSSRIKILVDNNEITQFIPIRGTEGRYAPLHLVTQEAEILSGFVWKPGDRPTSKQDLLERKRQIGGDEIVADTTDLPSGVSPRSASADTLDEFGESLPTDSIPETSVIDKKTEDMPADTAQSRLRDSLRMEQPQDSLVMPDSTIPPLIDSLRRDSIDLSIRPDTTATDSLPEPKKHTEKTVTRRSVPFLPSRTAYTIMSDFWIPREWLASAAGANQRVKAVPTGSQ